MEAVLKYPGAKNRLAPWILSFIPEHKVYLEPFAGSLAILLNKKRSHIETVNDLDGEIVNFFRVMRDTPGTLNWLLKETPYSREEYSHAYEHCLDPLERARRFVIRCWMGFGAGNHYRNGFRSGQQSNSPNPAKAWARLPQTITLASERMQGVQIEHMDAVELIRRYDTEDVFIYADPPYLPETRKGYLYKHEMSLEQHRELLQVLSAHSGKILLSGYDNELYDSLLPGWHKVQKATQAECGLRRTETLWMNYTPPAHQVSMEEYGVC